MINRATLPRESDELEYCIRITTVSLLRRYARFCVVGGTGVFVDMGILFVLADPAMLNWNLTLGKVIAAEVAIVNNFVWNDTWTFRGLGEKCAQARLARFGRFNLICTAGMFLSVVLLNVEVYWLEINPYVANCIAIVMVSLWNFLLNVKFGWKEKPFF